MRGFVYNACDVGPRSRQGWTGSFGSAGLAIWRAIEVQVNVRRLLSAPTRFGSSAN